VQYVGTSYGQDISNELQNKVTVILAEPVHSATVMARHATREQMIRTGQKKSPGSSRSTEDHSGSGS